MQEIIDKIKSYPQFMQWLEMLPDPVMVLSENFLILMLNGAACRSLKTDGSALTGRKPSKVMGYRNAYSGCLEEGFFKNPRYPEAEGMEQDCSIIAGDGSHRNFRISLKPYNLDGTRLVIMLMKDIADEKYRDSLERIFYNDITNTASGIYSLLVVLDNSPELFKEMSPQLLSLGQGLLDDIASQRDLRLVELGEIQPDREKVDAVELIQELCEYFAHTKEGQGRKIDIRTGNAPLFMYTDRRLLRRVLSNMLKNALEAAGDGDTVRVFVEDFEGGIRFAVQNPQQIPAGAENHLFERFYSTKGKGRGWGTYCMKLLTEKCLGGKISFVTSREDGTTFYADYPVERP
jgi:nitrogen fixation/metabolism regulation signal transduction histidine kinase